jgi:thiosulfate dehydrogenase [quinone] large subunit
MPNTDSVNQGHKTARSSVELLVLALLRVGVGWHFAYEGLTKLLDPNWTSAGYLNSTQWVGADFFHWLASNPTVLQVVDTLNIWGLLLIGGALMAGCLTRVVAVAGIVLLALYYVAHPPLFATQVGVTEGSYLIVNKNLVELLALCVVAVFPAGRFGLDGLLHHFYPLRRRATPQHTGDSSPADLPAPPGIIGAGQAASAGLFCRLALHRRLCDGSAEEATLREPGGQTTLGACRRHERREHEAL